MLLTARFATPMVGIDGIDVSFKATRWGENWRTIDNLEEGSLEPLERCTLLLLQQREHVHETSIRHLDGDNPH